MYKQTLQHFETIASIPHCSFEADGLKEYIKKYAIKCGFSVQEDKVGNVLCQKGEPKVCLQAHYDMVCMGKAPKIELFEEDGWLRAKDSSLGADNGMGMAMMMAMMSRHESLECLFTSDEEVGLLGAEGLELEIKSKNLLNLDSEEEDEVIIGCAGGVDIFGRISLEKIECDAKDIYEISLSGYEGGHSGIDIAKNIPNAMKVLVSYLLKNDCTLLEFSGGERNNSIPQTAKALILSDKKLRSDNPHICIKNLNKKENMMLKNSHKILGCINAFSQGVRMYDEELKMPRLSINFSTARQKEDVLELEFFARSMDDEDLENIKAQMKSLLEGFGFELSFKNQTSSWQPKKTPFALSVQKISQKYIENVKLHGIHAGLECGVIVEKQPHITGVCSIGPTIKYPHSQREKCLLSSVEKMVKVVDEVIRELG